MLDADLIESKAFLSLSGKAAMLTLIRFHQNAHRKRTKGKSKKIGRIIITNNGEIVFTYAEARELGIPDKTFYRALRELVEDKGFIDVIQRGHYQGQPTKFAISQRWKRYGTESYRRVEIGRILPRVMGFQDCNKNNPHCHP